LVEELAGGQVSTVDTETARRTFAAVHQAITAGYVRACHDLSEGGLAAAIAEMAFAGGLGAVIRLADVPREIAEAEVTLATYLLFSESNSRFLCEVRPDAQAEFERVMAGVPLAKIGQVVAEPTLEILEAGRGDAPVIRANIWDLKQIWQKPLRW
jgi:phosphoribosylformylglycinamidine synthase